LVKINTVIATMPTYTETALEHVAETCVGKSVTVGSGISLVVGKVISAKIEDGKVIAELEIDEDMGGKLCQEE